MLRLMLLLQPSWEKGQADFFSFLALNTRQKNYKKQSKKVFFSNTSYSLSIHIYLFGGLLPHAFFTMKNHDLILFPLLLCLGASSP